MIDFTFRQLTYFVAVAESGSISKAAAELHISHTAVSTALTELERIVNAQLLVRKKAQGVTLTATGLYFLEHTQQLLLDAEELTFDIASREGPLTGPLRVGCFTTLAPTIGSALWADYRESHPHVDLSLTVGTQSEIPDKVLGGELDLAIVYDSELPHGLNAITLSSTAPHVLLPVGHPLADRDEITLQELATEPMIEFDVRPSNEHNRLLFHEAKVEPKIALKTTDFELVRSLVARGFGYALLHQRPASDTSYEGRPLIIRPLESSAHAIRVLMVWSSDARLTARAKFMVDLARTFSPQSMV